MLAAIGLVSLPIYYLAFWVQGGPTAVPLVTVSNGQKTVVFQGMQHVGSEEFYKSVVFDLEKALTDGYTLFYEGVQPVPGRPELTEWFNKTLRGSDKDIGADYTKMADECGLQFQLNYFQSIAADMAIHPARHVTADVSYEDMKTEYDRLMREDPAFAAAMAAWQAKAKTAGGATDEFAPLVAAMAGTTPGQKRLIGIVCRGVLGMAISGALGDENTPTNRIIVDFRNRALARFVAESKADKIYITYGAAHFPGFFAELQRLDPAFSIRSIKGVRPDGAPGRAQPGPIGRLGVWGGVGRPARRAVRSCNHAFSWLQDLTLGPASASHEAHNVAPRALARSRGPYSASNPLRSGKACSPTAMAGQEGTGLVDDGHEGGAGLGVVGDQGLPADELAGEFHRHLAQDDGVGRGVAARAWGGERQGHRRVDEVVRGPDPRWVGDDAFDHDARVRIVLDAVAHPRELIDGDARDGGVPGGEVRQDLLDPGLEP